MSSRVVAVAALIIGSAMLAQPAAAQYRVHYGFYSAPPMEPSVTLYGGYMNLGQYVNGPLGTSASSGDAGLLGGQLTLPLSPNFALVGNVAHANSNLVFFAPTGGGPTIGNTEVWLFDGDAQLSAPFRGYGAHWVNPFVQFGAGAMRYETQNTLGGTSSTNFTFNVGGGLDYYVSRGVAFRVLAKDYIGHWDNPSGYPYYYSGRYTDNWSISGGLLFAL
jgi:hypothetical protein